MSKDTAIGALQAKLLDFAKQRDWEQFHSPKNLAAALSVEASELLEHFQWLSEDASYALTPDTHEEVAMELADVFLYTLLIAQKLDIDLVDAAEKKMVINQARYPADLVRGSAKKHHKY